MTRIHVICEGQTEETFVAEILTEPFAHKELYLTPALIGVPGHKGGNYNFNRLFGDVEKRLLRDNSVYCTTFFDFYGLPEDFPGKQEALAQASIVDKAKCVNLALAERLTARLGEEVMHRFIPYVQMYEFEGLLFSHPEKLAAGLYQPHLTGELAKIRNSFATPEEINNSPNTAPSKRIKEKFPGYKKPLFGTLAAIEIGLEEMRSECQLFDNWLKQLEALQQ